MRTRGVVSPRGITFGSYLRSGPSNSYCGKEFRPGDPVVLHARAEHEAVYRSKGEFVLLTISDSFLRKRAPDPKVDEILRSGIDHRQFHSHPDIARSTKTRLELIRNSIERDPSSIKTGDDLDRLKEIILEIFLDAIDKSVEEKNDTPDHSANSYKIFKKCEELIADDAIEFLTVSRLAAEVGVSRRTVHRAFVDSISEPPLRYITRWRLAKVRHDLRHGLADSVTSSARKWGFMELGRFAGYFRQEFGELPSETFRAHR